MIEKENLFCAIGDEPIQMIEVSKYINDLFNESTGFERCVAEPINNDTWIDFKHSVGSPSLFCQKRLFEINLRVKPTKVGEQILADIFDSFKSEDVFFLKILFKQRTFPAWLNRIINRGQKFTCYQLNKNEVPLWILKRLSLVGKKISREAAEYITERNEGNLIATANEVDKLALMLDSEKITLKQIIDLISDASTYSVYNLKDALYQGSAARVIKICRALRKDDVDPIIICWLLKKELKNLLKAKTRLLFGDSMKQIFGDYNIWQRDQYVFKNNVDRLESGHIISLLEDVSEILLGIKTGSKTHFWTEIEFILIKFIDPKIVTLEIPKLHEMSKIG